MFYNLEISFSHYYTSDSSTNKSEVEILLNEKSLCGC